jgi:post-segregation antitoxin (ccd killing protein)
MRVIVYLTDDMHAQVRDMGLSCSALLQQAIRDEVASRIRERCAQEQDELDVLTEREAVA